MQQKQASQLSSKYIKVCFSTYEGITSVNLTLQILNKSLQLMSPSYPSTTTCHVGPIPYFLITIYNALITTFYYYVLKGDGQVSRMCGRQPSCKVMRCQCSQPQGRPLPPIRRASSKSFFTDKKQNFKN